MHRRLLRALSATVRPFLPPLRTPNASPRRAIPPRSRALSAALYPLPPPLRTPNASSRRAISPRPCSLSAKANAKSPRIFAFSSPLSEKSPLVLEKSPHVFLPTAPTGSPSAAVAQRINFTSSGESAQKCARVHFFLLLIAFILKKTRYICNENPFYHLCVAKHQDRSSTRCVRRTACKLPHLARL